MTPRDKILPKALNSQNKGVYGGILSREDNKRFLRNEGKLKEIRR